MQNTLNIWKLRTLSIKGKITVVNNLALAPLIYVASVTDTPSNAIIEIERCVNDFIWGSKRAKIARAVLEQNIDNGGMKLCNFKSKVDALKLSWVNRMSNSNDSNWTAIPRFYYGTKDILYIIKYSATFNFH